MAEFPAGRAQTAPVRANLFRFHPDACGTNPQSLLRPAMQFSFCRLKEFLRRDRLTQAHADRTALFFYLRPESPVPRSKQFDADVHVDNAWFGELIKIRKPNRPYALHGKAGFLSPLPRRGSLAKSSVCMFRRTYKTCRSISVMRTGAAFSKSSLDMARYEF